MKYFAIFIIGLFAYSQAMPVEEISEEKRFNPVLIGAAKFVFDSINTVCQGIGNPTNPADIIGRACSCVKAGGHVIGGGGGGGGGVLPPPPGPPDGDESIPEEKRFFLPDILNPVLGIIKGLVDQFCANPQPGFHAEKCRCIRGH